MIVPRPIAHSSVLSPMMRKAHWESPSTKRKGPEVPRLAAPAVRFVAQNHTM